MLQPLQLLDKVGKYMPCAKSMNTMHLDFHGKQQPLNSKNNTLKVRKLITLLLGANKHKEEGC